MGVTNIPVKSLSEFKPGDHGCIDRKWGLYKHHFIVTKVLREKIKTVEFNKNADNQTEENKYTIGWIYKGVFDENSGGGIYKVEYDDCCYKPELTIKIAMCLQECLEPGHYNLFANNCEHIATFCKTGCGDSSQVREGSNKGLLMGTTAIGGGALSAAILGAPILPLAVLGVAIGGFTATVSTHAKLHTAQKEKASPTLLNDGVLSINGHDRLRVMSDSVVEFRYENDGKWETYQ